jgi:hypothetical protein
MFVGKVGKTLLAKVLGQKLFDFFWIFQLGHRFLKCCFVSRDLLFKGSSFLETFVSSLGMAITLVYIGKAKRHVLAIYFALNSALGKLFPLLFRDVVAFRLRCVLRGCLRVLC